MDNVKKMWKLLNEQVEYVVIEETSSCYYVLVRNLAPLKKQLCLNDNHIFVVGKQVQFIFIESNHGFLDPTWEEMLFQERVVKDGFYILPMTERKYIEIYDSYCHADVFRYRNKEFINEHYGESVFYSTNQLVHQLEHYMNLHGYHYYFCNLSFVGMNEKLLKKYQFIRKFDYLLLLFHFIQKKIPGLFCKFRFFFLKKYNSFLWPYRRRKIQNVLGSDLFFQEIDKKEIKFGCKYYKVLKKSENYAFLKGYDHYCIADHEIDANRLLYSANSNHYLTLIYSQKGQYTLFEFLTDETLEDILLKRNLTSEEIQILIRSMKEILSDFEKFRIIHRDIAPKNIILKYQNEKLVGVKIIDFGYAVIDNHEYLNMENIFERKILRSLGDTFKPDLYFWDDAVATLNMLETIDEGIYQNYKTELEPIIQRKGKLTIGGYTKDENSIFNFTL